MTSNKPKSKSKEGKSKVKYEIPKLTELENEIVLRMPEPYSSSLRDALQSGGLKDRLQIDFEEDARHATVKFDKVVFAAKLYDLPCIVETWKTFDKKSLWKTGDMCQVLICKDPDEPDSSSEEEENLSMDYIKRKLQETKKYQYAHGLTPPLKNVRKRRFRKTAKQKYIDAPEIEKEVKRLLRADVSAVDVKFEIINDELESKKLDKEEEIDIGGPTLEQFNENSNFSMFSDDIALDEGDILPDISSSDEEENTETNEVKKEKSHMHIEYEKKLMEIREKKLEQEMRVRKAANPFLKQRFQTELDNLKQQEEKFIAEMEELNL
ncbi:transcription initiation factor TFIID subunit 7 [Hydra vulgaris]|uniref:transcription initiation factor TFIID subunit 7 n=1 Tax=Hydra vulgaris TaxID=6087 RepID=UPI001F5FD3AF|nr:transcription initiation factor TFIID subunit 7-like [Hydra vulgaris]